MGTDAFCYCKQLKNVRLDEEPQKLGGNAGSDGRRYGRRVFAHSGVESVRLPSSLKGLEAETFEFCDGLRSIEVPSGVERIGERCFYWSGIEEVTLPATLREIGEDAFKNCNKLRIVWVKEGCAVDIRQRVDGSVRIVTASPVMVCG